MPLKFSPLLLCLFFVFSAQSQILNQDEIIETRPEADDYLDLQRLKKLWQDKRLVLLGEQSHGEGTVFAEKVRLIQFLHQEMDFDLVVFESGMYDNYKAFNQIKNGAGLKNGPLEESIFSIWSDTDELAELIEYVHRNVNTPNELEIAGFDFLKKKTEFWEDLKREITLPSNSWARVEEILMGNAELLAENNNDSIAFFKVIENITQQFENVRNKSIHQKIMEQSFKGWVFEIKWQLDDINGKKTYVQNPRDEWMAKNLIFLSELYPDRKIIGWGASYHFANEVTNFRNSDLTKEFILEMSENEKRFDPHYDDELFDLDKNLDGAISMGKYLKAHFGEALFSLAFSSYQGTYGVVYEEKRLPIVTPPEGSIEHELVFSGIESGIVDYSNSDMWYYSSALGNLPILAEWQSIFDGLYFIKNMSPPTMVSYEDQQLELSTLTTEKGNNLFGKVIDANSKESIPYANISLQGTAKGVSTNSIGEFMFNNYQNGVLVFSCIGYENDTLQFANIPDKSNVTIALKPKSYLLSDLVITDKPLSAKDIVRLANKAIESNYYRKPFNQEVYYKVNNVVDDSIFYNDESANMLYFEKGFSPKSKIFGTTLQYRNTKLPVSKNIWEGAGSLWLVTGHDVILDKDNPVFRTGAYELKIKGILEFEGRKVYDINFDCNRPSAFTTGFGYPAPESSSGHIYIAMDDYAILKYEVCTIRQPYTSKRKKHFTYYPQHHHLTQTYKRNFGHYFLNTSFTQHKSRISNSKTGESNVSSRLWHLTTTEIVTDNVIPIDRPLINIKAGSSIKEVEDFWVHHNYVIDPGKNHVFYCADSTGFNE